MACLDAARLCVWTVVFRFTMLNWSAFCAHCSHSIVQDSYQAVTVRRFTLSLDRIHGQESVYVQGIRKLDSALLNDVTIHEIVN